MDLLNAFKAAANKQNEKKPHSSTNEKTEATVKKHKSNNTASKSSNHLSKTDTTKSKGGARYVISAGFKTAIENYLKNRTDMTMKLRQKGKSIDGCCDYIFDVMRRRAEKERKGQSAVGLYAEPDEIFGLAVHYYDETEESLKNELKAK